MDFFWGFMDNWAKYMVGATCHLHLIPEVWSSNYRKSWIRHHFICLVLKQGIFDFFLSKTFS